MMNDRLFNGAERQSLEWREGIDNAIGDSTVRFPRCAMQKERSYGEKWGNRLFDDPPQGGRWRSEARSPALQEPIFDHFWAPNSANTPKKRKVIG